MKKLITASVVLAFMFSLSSVAVAAPKTAKTQCQKWALEDNTVKPWELMEFVRSCTAEVEKTGVANASRYRWKKGR